MKLKDFLDSPEEIFVGAMLQFPLYFIVGWYVVPIQILCGLLWRWGGVSGGFKLARRIGVPLTVCMATAITFHKLSIFIAIPFMIWLMPSYGADGWLFKTSMKITNNHAISDILTRSITYFLYWTSFLLVLVFIK